MIRQQQEESGGRQSNRQLDEQRLSVTHWQIDQFNGGDRAPWSGAGVHARAHTDTHTNSFKMMMIAKPCHFIYEVECIRLGPMIRT